MRWRGRRVSSNVEDRRGVSGAGKAGGVGIIGIIIAFALYYFLGIDPSQTMSVAQQMGQATTQSGAPEQLTAEQKEISDFVGVVLADTEDTWSAIFKQSGQNYPAPKLQLYHGVTQSACGTGKSAMGPFYCPADQKVYIDTHFFVEMRQKMGISGEKNQSTELSVQGMAGDFAQAYVIAHEIGHHIQTITGISNQVREQQLNASTAESNNLSVRQELQADCFAGLWANHTQQRTKFLDEGDIQEAMDAAQKIGDDYLQRKAQGRIVPDSFTHGTSEQRQRWFAKGFKSGDINQCNTFGAGQV